ncbi:thiamine pyrophosphate-binding protein [Dactylosporangium sp. NBC_01737]|uniref:alpha-keto acid decarboxylase family protein n=1 Tax=Dactylosporangium sp. NBC_01737 TaxID=2975959 RepID=UPI002E0EF6A5|nr:thiamine pyrophosphate-binding protein [Dactylosporangium sp. NBC_01737]
MSTSTIGDFLLRRLREAGIGHVFGVPGDYNLELLQQLEDGKELAWIGTCNELNAAYAADGAARLHGLAALVVTNGVGALSAINGIAGAYSEHVPVICICGSPPMRSTGQGRLMHHTLADGGGPDAFLRCFAEVTAAQARLTPQNAAAEIDRIILTARQRKLPVYLEVPSDIAYLTIQVPDQPLMLTTPASDPERLDACTAALVHRLRTAQAPAILADLDADRFGVAADVAALASRLQAPVAVLNTAKSVIDEHHPLFAGVYTGGGSPPDVRAAVEDSDCLLTIGYRRVDSTSGFFTDTLPPDAVHLHAWSADVGDTTFQAVALADLLPSLVKRLPERPEASFSHPVPRQNPPAGELTQAGYWRTIQRFLRPGDVLLAEDGTSSAGATGLRLPPECTFVTQAVWGSIGYTLGALLGTLTAAPHRRQLLFIGDGSFQLTAQELSTILRHGHKPYIFLINNAGYTIERAILGRHAAYNDVANWAYADLPKVLAPDTPSTSFVVRTVEELDAALAAEHDGLVFIEAVMAADDAPPNLIHGGHAFADLDYGPRGPQHRPDAQL